MAWIASLLVVWWFLISAASSLTLSSPMIHRFSSAAPASAGGGSPAIRGSPEYYKLLIRSDLGRQKRRYRTLFPSEGSQTYSLGNDFGWCSLVYGALIMQDKDLGMFRPSESRTSRHLACSHALCSLGPSCNSPKQPCPYTVNYVSENTSSSGLLVEDTIYLASDEGHTSVHAPVIIGCGRKQSGGYLDGIAPDGLLGLGFGNISVPSILARSGLVRDSFSMCFQDDDSGRIFFGDQGVPTQQSTPFVPWEGKYIAYIIGVESFCIKSQCLGKTSFQAQVDSGSSFTYLPEDVYKRVTLEFHRQVNAPRFLTDKVDWEYCYKASPLEMPEVPTLTLKLAVNKSFVVANPIFPFYGEKGEIVAFCLAVQSCGDNPGTIGHNFMAGYRMVFDRENLKLGWSHSNCRDLGNSSTVPRNPPSHKRTENPLPTDEQQSSSSNSSTVSPAVAGRTSEASLQVVSPLVFWFLLLLVSLAVIPTGVV